MKSVFNAKKKSFILLCVSVFAALIVTIGMFTHSKVANADSGLAPGTLVAQDNPSTVIKDTICVKRWEECTFSLYYLGAYDDVFIAEVHTAMIPTSSGTITFTSSNQLMSSYSVSSTISASVTLELGITKSISIEGFMKQASSKATSSLTATYAETVGISETSSIGYSASFDVGTAENPLNYVYGNILMINHAYKFKLVVHKQHRAKHRKSALHKWGAYQIETESTTERVFYALNGNNAVFYQKIGLIGTQQQYSNIIHNVGK